MFKFKPRAAPEDRRRTERHAVRGLAKIQTGTGSLPRDCWITDMSDGGVRLHSERNDVPDEFILVLPGMHERRECRVAWRLGHEIGAQFIDGVTPGFARKIARR
jgi:PilZ domain